MSMSVLWRADALVDSLLTIRCSVFASLIYFDVLSLICSLGLFKIDILSRSYDYFLSEFHSELMKFSEFHHELMQFLELYYELVQFPVLTLLSLAFL